MKNRLSKLERDQAGPTGSTEIQEFTHYPLTGLYRSTDGKYYTEAEFEALRPAGLPGGAIWCIVIEHTGDDSE